MLLTYVYISAPELNYDRKTLFRVIKEAITLAGDVIDENNCELPLPENLFTLIPQEEIDNSENTNSSDNSSDATSLSSSVSDLSYNNEIRSAIEFQTEFGTKQFKLPKIKCDCNICK